MQGLIQSWKKSSRVGPYLRQRSKVELTYKSEYKGIVDEKLNFLYNQENLRERKEGRKTNGMELGSSDCFSVD